MGLNSKVCIRVCNQMGFKGGNGWLVMGWCANSYICIAVCAGE